MLDRNLIKSIYYIRWWINSRIWWMSCRIE